MFAKYRNRPITEILLATNSEPFAHFQHSTKVSHVSKLKRLRHFLVRYICDALIFTAEQEANAVT